MTDLNKNNDRIAELVFKHLIRQLSEGEKAELDQWMAASEANHAEFLTLTERARLKLKLEDYNQFNSEGIWQKITNDIPELNATTVKQNKHVWFRVAIAAAVLVALLLGGWLFLTRNFKKDGSQQTVTVTKDISPGGNKAILILGDGTKVVLDTAQHGVLAQQGKTSISKKREGEVIYNANHSVLSEVEGSPLTYNTITTPRGGQYHVILPDGSHVWLNAASSIHFPTQFAGKERKVELTGEAYFEVVADKSKPFIVSISEATIQVLGTHFNVNSYSNEDAARITLLEGSVKVKRQSTGLSSQPVFIVPGEQAIFPQSKNEIIKIDKNVDEEQVMAWKNGSFQFNGETIEAVMRQIERWYDVETVYQNKDTGKRFGGMISRNTNLSEVLKALELSDVHFKIERKKIIVQ